MRWLALLLAASMLMQVPGLVGIGPSGARAARPAPSPTPKPKRNGATPTPTAAPSNTPTPTAIPTPSYTASLSVDGNCMATIVARWNNATLQSVDVQLNDRTSQSSVPEHSTVSGTSGSQTFSVPLNSLLTGPVLSHTFHAVVDFVSSGNSLAQEIYTNSQNGPCYIGQVGP
jgi:hypothetical protein